MGKQAINLRFDAGLLGLVDGAAGAGLRTQWIEDACRQRLQRERDAPPEAWRQIGSVKWDAEGVAVLTRMLDE